MEEVLTSAHGISLLLVCLSFNGVVSTLIFRSPMSLFIRIMWVMFIWMLPFLGSLAWLYLQSFDHKFQMDGGPIRRVTPLS